MFFSVSKSLKFIFYNKGAKISWFQDLMQILSQKIGAPQAGQNLQEI